MRRALNVLDLKLLRDLRMSKGMLLAITSIMACGVGCYVAMGSAYRNLTLAQRQYYDQCRMADFSVEVKKAPLTALAAVAEIPGVVEVRPRIQFFVTVDLERVAEPLNGLVLSLPDRRQPTLNDIVLKRGGYFTDRRENEAIVNDAFARRHGLHPGQWLHLLLNDRRQEMFIVGTAVSSEFVYLLGPGAIVPDDEHFGVFYLKHSYAEEAFAFEGAANQVLGKLAPNVRDNPGEILRRAELLLADYGVLATIPLRDQPSHRFLGNEISGLGTFGKIMPGIFLVAAALVLNVLMSRTVEQQRVTIGALKAMGYGNGEVFAHFLKFGLAAGLAGGVAGCLVGYGMSALMTGVYQKFFQFPALTNRLNPLAMTEGLLISLACGAAGTLHGARTVLRLEPAEAMRAKPPARGGPIWLERWPRFWRRLDFGWRLTLRNIVRRPLRSLATMFAASLGASIMVNGLMMAQASTEMVDFQFNRIMRSDVDLSFKDEQGAAALDEVRRLPGVDRAEPVLDVACTFIHGARRRKAGVSGLSPDARLTVPRNADGLKLRIPAVGLLMSRKLAEMLDLRVGQTVTMLPVKGRREPLEVPIAEITDSFIGLAVYADIDYLARLVDEEFACTGAQLAVHPTLERRNSLYRELKQMPALRGVSARADLIANVMNTLIANQQVFISLLVMFAGIIFFGSVLNSSLVSLAERVREVATWRVQGYGEWQIGGLFLRESVLLNSLGTLLGLPLGLLMTMAVTRAYDTEMFRIPVVAPWTAWAMTLTLGGAFGLLAHGCVQRAIFRLDWLQALQAKE